VQLRTAQSTRRRSTLESGTAPQLEHPLTRSRPRISAATERVDDCLCSPADKRPGLPKPSNETNLTPCQLSRVCGFTGTRSASGLRGGHLPPTVAGTPAGQITLLVLLTSAGPPNAGRRLTNPRQTPGFPEPVAVWCGSAYACFLHAGVGARVRTLTVLVNSPFRPKWTSRMGQSRTRPNPHGHRA
jgi:hypothetical protein